MLMLQAISLAKNIFIQCDSLSILFNRMLANEILKLLNFLSVNVKEKEKQNQKDIAYISSLNFNLYPLAGIKPFSTCARIFIIVKLATFHFTNLHVYLLDAIVKLF